MLRLAAAGATEGDWLMADRQTAGRGRLGRTWESPLGNLHTSGLVRVHPGDPDAATLALVAAVAVHDAVTIWADGAPCQLKWPNDLLIGGAKMSGILLERVGDAVVIGIGVNLVMIPEGLNRPVTSLAMLGTAVPEPRVFLDAVADLFARWLMRWRGDGLAAIRRAWLDRAHPAGTALVASLPDGDMIEGLFDGLTEGCALRLRLADGAVRVIHAGDVFLL